MDLNVVNLTLQGALASSQVCDDLNEVTGGGWILEQRPKRVEGSPDAVIVNDSLRVVLLVEVKTVVVAGRLDASPKPSAEELKQLAATVGKKGYMPIPVLLVARLSDQLRAVFSAHHINALDAHGNVLIQVPGLVIHVVGRVRQGLEGLDRGVKPGTVRDQILQFVSAADYEKGVTASEIIAYVGKTKENTNKEIVPLLESGLIRRISRGVYGPGSR